ncbi:MAG: YggS family pyridoxal phosphate-dependent enzyme, partial [Deltaproteobacteria bacterium]|nr:YggS family pyridoxal phosphate-dependent enzyme [Deltaproteobacteria bacterium]
MRDPYENFSVIREKIRQAAGPHRFITVLGVTKGQSAERVQAAVSAGVEILGVNYVQEGEQLQRQIKDCVQWHFIGHIQSRKVKYLGQYSCVQSIDRISVATALNEKLANNRKLPVLIEINIGNEQQKSGVLPEAIEPFVEALSRLPNLQLKGFMCMPPALEPPILRASFFKQMRKIFEIFEKPHGLQILSMGTSDDYLIAVAEGATMVRLGTC